MGTFYDQLLECERRWPNNIALQLQRRDSVESYTYSDVRHMAESVGRWIGEQGHGPGSRLAILAANHPRWIAAYLGTIAAGCTAVPLDTSLGSDQVAKLVKDSGSSVLFVDGHHLDLAKESISDLDVDLALTSSERTRESTGATGAEADLDNILAQGPGNFRPPRVSSDDLAVILYTSGTTADPKGVMLTHANLMGEAEAVFSWAPIGPEDAILGILPLFHALAQMANLLLPLVRGSRVVYLETLNTTELLRALRERDITAFACVPQFFYLIHERIKKEVARRGKLAQVGIDALMWLTRLSRPLGLNFGKLFFPQIHQMFGSKMRYLVTGGSRWDPEIGRYFYSLGIDIYQAYGLTETTGGAFATPMDDNVIGSVGKPLQGVEAKIVDHGLAHDGPPEGEIAIRGPIVMKGYWRRPDATREILREGWLYTGDLGHFDARGNLFITGRKKEVIVLSAGKNIYPEEIEAHYAKSPLVKEMCVMGLVTGPDDPFAERLHAVIVPNFEILKQRKIVNTHQAIRFDVENLSQQLPPAKRILSYDLWQEELPRTTTRKLKRFEIEQRVRANQEQRQRQPGSEPALSADEQSWLGRPDVERALNIVRSTVKVAPGPLRPKHNLELDLHLDSIERVELVVALENELGGDVEESRISEIYTVRELVDAVLGSRAAQKSGTPGSPFAGWSSVLREETTDPDVLAIAEPRPIATVFWFLMSRVVQLFARDFFQLRVTGLEKLNPKGPFILSPNHQSYLDPIVLASILPWPVFHEAFAVGTSEIFGSGPMRTLARWLRIVVVDPDANLIPALRAGAFGLGCGRVLVVFPEGERTIDGTPKAFKKGAAILATHLQVPIFPVAIEGFYQVWPRGKKFVPKPHPLRIAFGDPLYPPIRSEPSEAAYSQLTTKLHDRVLEMWRALRGEKHQEEERAAAAD